jgi:hypothetical protein
MPADEAKNGESAGTSVDVEELYQRLREEVRRSGSDPGAASSNGGDRRIARADAERLWPVSADRSLRLRPGVRGGVGTPVKAVLRKLMRWYVEPVATHQRSYNLAILNLVDELAERVDADLGKLESRIESLEARLASEQIERPE